jgi:hypothetical protein
MLPDLLNDPLRENICDLDIQSAIISSSLLETIGYACVYQAHHLKVSHYSDLGDITMILQDFLRHTLVRISQSSWSASYGNGFLTKIGKLDIGSM